MLRIKLFLKSIFCVFGQIEIFLTGILKILAIEKVKKIWYIIKARQKLSDLYIICRNRISAVICAPCIYSSLILKRSFSCGRTKENMGKGS